MFEFRNDFNVAELESLTIEIRLPFTKPIILMTLYRPESPVKVYNDINNPILNILFEDKVFIMMGDVNAILLSKPLHNDAKHMKNMYDSDNLTQVITEPTRTTDNTKHLLIMLLQTDHLRFWILEFFLMGSVTMTLSMF